MTLATTVDALLERVRRDAMLSSYGPFYTLGATITDSETMLTVSEHISHLTVGSVIAIDAELMRITEIHHASDGVSVVRGAFGSTATAHTEGTLVEQDCRTPKAALLDWAELEIRSWNKVLFRVNTLTLAADKNNRTYDLAGVDTQGVDFLLEVRAEPLNAAADTFGSSWVQDSWPHVEAQLLRNMPVADFPSGYALQLTNLPRYAGDMRVAYASPFNLTALTLATDLVSTVGLDPNYLDILEQGLRQRALSASMTARTDWRATGMARDAEEVTVLDVVRAVDMARSIRDRRLNEEAVNLRSRYAYRSR